MPEYQYPHRFMNQFARVPEEISRRLGAEFGGEYAGVRHCLGLIIANMLAHGTVAYSRRFGFYVENRTAHYTRTNMLKAAEIAVRKGWATTTKGFMSKGYSKGISSTISPTGELMKDFAPIDRLETGVELLPILTLGDRPIYNINDIPSVLKASSAPMPIAPTTYGIVFKLNREYFNRMRIYLRITHTPLITFSILNARVSI